ncbi:MAG: TonB-dependent siderophore receptor, partial [Vicinamibacterales bacterium]
DVTVIGRAARYAETSTTVFGKMPVSQRDVPNSVSVLTREQIEDQNMVTTWDALSQVTGVTAISNDATQAQYHARGAALENQQDGMPSAMALSGYQQYDLAIYDRVEVLRGPAGLLQGSGSFSGTVNMVRRRPGANLSTSLLASTGQWANNHVEAVASGPLVKSLRGLAVFSATNRDYFWNRGHDEKWLGYGMAEWRPGSKTTVGLTTAHQKDRTPGFSGLPTYTDGTYLPVDRSFNPYPTWNQDNWDTTDVGVEAEHRITPKWSVTARANRRLQTLMFHDGYPTTGVSLTTNTANYARRESTFDYTSDAVDTFMSGRFDLLGRSQDVLVGFNAAKFTSEGHGVNPNQDATLNVTNVLVTDPPAVAEPLIVYRTGSLSQTDQQGLYTMLRSRLTSRVTTVVGGRWSNYNNRSKSVAPSTPTDWTQGARSRGEFTPYGGAVLTVLPQLSAYGSYSEIFVPQTSKRVDGSILDPRTGRQYELGVKAEPLGGRLLATLAYFNIHDRNRAYADPLNTGFFVPLGEVESTGWEAEATGRVRKGWDLVAGYTHLHTEYLVNLTLKGQPLSYWYPGDSFKLWSTWRGTSGRLAALRFGLGVQASGKSASGTDTKDAAGNITVYARRQSRYAVVTANGSYMLRSNVDLNVQFNNMFDAVYYTRLGGTNTYNSFGDPRNVMVSLRWNYAGARAASRP